MKNVWILYKNGNRTDCRRMNEYTAHRVLASIANFAEELNHPIEYTEGPALSGDFGLIETTPQGKIEYLMKCTLA